MFCTGGIRCEKSTNYLLGQGVEEVFHLKGGILKYLEEVPEAESLWQGECFVFDERVSVGHGLRPGAMSELRSLRAGAVARRIAPTRPMRRACACAACRDELFSDADRARFRERQRQIDLAAARGQRHMGPG